MSEQELAYAPAWRLAEMVRRREVSPVELVETSLGRVERFNPRLNAFLTVTTEEARAEAKRAEARATQGGDLPPLHGVPISIKDLINTRGIRTTHGSLVYKDNVPDEDGVVVERVRAAGAVILGKTNTSEFGQSATTENRLGDACRNPWDASRTSGGSSGGASAGVATGMSPLAVGSDGGGSIRIPAAFCGVYGIKPSQGRVPAHGGLGGMPLFSQNGPITRSVRDAAMLLQVLAGFDRRDPRCLRVQPPDFVAALEGGVKGMRVAWSPDMGFAAVEPEVLEVAGQAARRFEELGCVVEEATPPFVEDPFAVFRVIVATDAYANLGFLLEEHADDLAPYSKATIEHGGQVPGHEYSRALRGLEGFRAEIADFFESYDLLVLPGTAVPAFPVGERPSEVAGHKVSRLWGAFPFTMLFNVTGQPAATLPVGTSREGLPIGLMVVGRVGDEATVLRASAAYEEACPWASRRPPE